MLPTFVVGLLFISSTYSEKLPKDWKLCKRDDANMNECLKEAILVAVKHMKNGNTKFGILPVDPLRIKSLIIEQGSGPVSVKLMLKDIDLYGYTDATITSVRNDWKDAYVDVISPKLSLTGKYKLEGKVLALPIVGEGDCKLEADNYTAAVHLVFEKFKKHDKEYYKVIDYSINSNAETGRMHFTNLFNGDKLLGNTMNQFLNENFNLILNEVNPAMSKAFGEQSADMANKILTKVAIDDLFQ